MSRFSLTDRLRSFGFAFKGLGYVLRTQHNAWIHLVASGVVVGIALFLGSLPFFCHTLLLVVLQSPL